MTESPPLPSSTEQSTEPRGLPSFADIPLSDEVRKALDAMGYDSPTPVQLAVWEPAVNGKDVVVQARTGTGKTCAFGLPLVDRIVRRSTPAVQALVLCPTRELALQVTRELDQLGQHKGVSSVAVYGGAPIGRQIDALASGTPIVVGTPGRVLDHLRRRTLDPSSIRALVLDESDEMLSMGFEKELTAIVDRLPNARQTLLFSATLPPDIERIVRTKLHDPEFVLLSGDHIGALEVAHFFYLVARDKLGALRMVLEVEDPESALIFCNTREETSRVAQDLQRHGYSADWLNGDLPQSDREKVMAATRAGELRLLVATDVASRGIDLSHLTHVINFGFPQDAEGYVHRTGRTGRAGRLGTAISLVTAQEVGAMYILRLTYGIRPMERHLPSAREQQSRVETDVINAMALALPSAAAAGPKAQALAQRLLSHDASETLVAGLIAHFLGTRAAVDGRAGAQRREPRPQVAAPRTRSAAPVAPAPRREADRPRPEPESPRRDADRPRPESEGPRRDADRPRPEPEGPRREPAGDATASATERAEVAAAPGPARRARAGADEDAKNATTALGASPDAPTLEQGGDAPAEDEAASSFVELYVNVGRKEAVRTRDIRELLHDDGGLPPEEVGRVRIRERCSFVEVARERADDAIELLERGRFEGRAVRANVSERAQRG